MDAEMFQNFGIFPYILSHINHTACTLIKIPKKKTKAKIDQFEFGTVSGNLSL